MDEVMTGFEEDLAPLSEMPQWLQALSRADVLRGAIAEAVPEFRSGSLSLLEVKRDRLRLKDDAWTAAYGLTTTDEAGQTRDVRVRGLVQRPSAASTGAHADEPFGSPDWRLELPEYRVTLETEPPDGGLPALPTLVDPERARALLESAIRSCSPRHADIAIEACEPTIARYHPGNRCTIVYRLTYGADREDWPDLVVAKTYRGNKGRVAWDAMTALWESPLGSSDVVHIAEPLAFLPELNVLVQGPVREELTISDLLEEFLVADSTSLRERLQASLRQAGQGLAAMHVCGVHLGETVTFEDEVAEIRDLTARLGAWIPEVRGAGARTLERLEALGARHAAGPIGPAHRSFRPAQVLIFGEEISFIDFDGFCRSEPAIDVALFRATMKNMSVRLARKADDPAGPLHALDGMLVPLDELCEDFTQAYQRSVDISRQRVALWEGLDLLTNVLHNWSKVRPERIDGTLRLLQRHLDGSVDGWRPDAGAALGAPSNG
jgi:hypothetical protein